MATTSETIYTHTCDLCGTEHDRKELRRFGLTHIAEGGIQSRHPEITGCTCDVCPDCATRPVNEVLAILDPPEDAELADLRQMTRGRADRSA